MEEIISVMVAHLLSTEEGTCQSPFLSQRTGKTKGAHKSGRQIKKRRRKNSDRDERKINRECKTEERRAIK